MNMKKLTAEQFLHAVFENMKAAGYLSDREPIKFGTHEVSIDYWSERNFDVPDVLTNYEFDIEAVPQPGSNEGIYVNVYISGDWGQSDKSIRRKYLGCIKTLDTGLDAVIAMGAIAGALTWYAGRIADEIIQRISPENEIKAWAEYQENHGKHKFAFFMKNNPMTCEDGYLLVYASDKQYALKSFEASLYKGAEYTLVEDDEIEALKKGPCINTWSTR